MKFSILIPAYNEGKTISACLQSMLSVNSEEKEIIVIDDASTDNTFSVVEKFLSQGIIVTRRKKNGGRAAALNTGLKIASGDIIITTDADTVVPKNWLTQYKTHFEKHDVLAVGGTYRARNTHKPLVKATSVLDQVLNEIFKKSIVPNKLSGVNSAILKSALSELGGFNENSWWSEDSELGWKLRKKGNVIYDANNVVSTLYPDTWVSIWKRKFYWGYAMGLKFRERFPFHIRLWLRPMIFLLLFVSLLFFLLTIPFGFRSSYISGGVFIVILSLLTIVYVPFGCTVMIKNRDSGFLKILTILAVLPFIREFAYVYGMCLGYYRGKTGKIKPSWKEK